MNEPIVTNTDREIVQYVLAWVKSYIKVPLSLESLATDTAQMPCAMQQTLTGDPIIRRYKDGSKLKRYRFAIYYRTANPNTRDHIDAMAELNHLIELLENNPPKDFGKKYDYIGVQCDTLPAKIYAEEQFEDYQTTFTLVYKKEK